jgi:hypothetical protein
MLNGDIWPYANLFHNMTGSNDYDNMMNTDAPASFNYYSKYVELPAVRKMIHVGNAKFPFVRVMSHCWIYIQNCWFPRFCCNIPWISSIANVWRCLRCVRVAARIQGRVR